MGSKRLADRLVIWKHAGLIIESCLRHVLFVFVPTDWVDWPAWKFSSSQETDYVPDRPDGMAFQSTATMRGRQWEDPQLWQQSETVSEVWRVRKLTSPTGRSCPSLDSFKRT